MSEETLTAAEPRATGTFTAGFPCPVPQKLAAKLVEAALDVEGVGKRGRNTQQNYTYATAEDVAEAAARALLKQRVFVDFEVVGHHAQPIRSGRGADGLMVTVTGRLVATDAESGESTYRTVVGAGTDYPGDKAYYKAMTGARKYGLIHLLQLPIGDEPDATPRREAIEREAIERERADQILQAIKARRLTYKAIDQLLGAAGIDALRARSPKALRERIGSLTPEEADALERELGGDEA